MLLHYLLLPLPTPWTSQFLLAHHRRRLRSGTPLRALEKDSEFEIDRDKAREALRKLDQQLESLSQKQPSAPKRRPAPPPPPLDLYNEKESMLNPKMSRSDELPEMSGSFLAYSAVLLLAISIFYNVLFLLVIKPAIDGNDMEPAALTRETSKEKVELQAPLLSNQN